MVYENGMNGISQEPRIAVVGVGGAGCKVINEFYGSLCSVDTIAINTDKEALHNTSADTKIYICKEVLKGEGARGDTTLGKKCADIHKEEIREALSNHDFVFIIAGLGGGTGTGAAPVVIEAAQSQNIMTFAIAISPFSFEFERAKVAKPGFAAIKTICANSILVENDLVVKQMPNLTPDKAFREVNRSIMKYVMDQVRIVEEIYQDEMDRSENIGIQKVPEKTFPIGLLMSA